MQKSEDLKKKERRGDFFIGTAHNKARVLREYFMLQNLNAEKFNPAVSLYL